MDQLAWREKNACQRPEGIGSVFVGPPGEPAGTMTRCFPSLRSMAIAAIYPYDPQLGSAWFSARHVVWKAQPGAIIVLHDYGSRGERTAAALDSILPELRQQGYRLVTLSALTNLESVVE
jgi:peptidoglycan/xylan/chitin deacetylase (PgdA/CDA1 family)